MISNNVRINNVRGYPWRLHSDRIPIQLRIIAIADIFEALTAMHRP
ncbi:HD domain-containing phosphohydrolase [uncultured Desulfobacter sp.]